MRSSQAVEVITAVSLHGGRVKLLQARREAKGSITLLGMKTRQARGSGEESLVQDLRQIVQSLPEAPTEVIGLFSSDAILTRYLSLPSQDPAELQAMALYQLEGSLPYPIQQCVVSVRALGPMGEATRVLVAVAHRPEVEKLVRVCGQAGLKLTRIASSTEAVGCWHQACWPEEGQASSGWLVAEFTEDGLDLGVLLKGSLAYVRHVPHVTGDWEDLAARLEETLQAYRKERLGADISRVSVSGRLDLLAPGALERLEATLGLPVHRIDPLERSPFRDALALAAKELVPEISFSDLLGVVCVPRLLDLDLLPLETRLGQARQAAFRQARRGFLLLVSCFLAVAVWAGLRTAGVFWALRQCRTQTRLLEPQVARVQRQAEVVRDVGAARGFYARQMRWMSGAAQRLPPGMTLQFLGLEGDQTVVLRGNAPDLTAVTNYSAALRADALWGKVTLRAARVHAEQEQGNVEFELALFPKE